MVKTDVERYIEQLIPKRGALIEEMEEYAKNNGVPIMDIVGIEALLQVLRLYHPKKILEVGTAIGYSAIRMALCLPDSIIWTIERDEERYDLALANIKKAGLDGRIEVLYGDATDLVDEVAEKGPFDFIFIDAAKGQYERYFENYGNALGDKGVIVSDNVLFKGYVANDENLESRRMRSLVKKIRNYNDFIMKHPGFVTTILPVGDGMAISIKKEKAD
ncbi:O-methyltransferase [Fictibacillus gelatini]|uniref:O-methyltransferase n=1 Tax=Fictibacillus gelatini TaxID=225985 RepID=UPI00041BED7C|nr:O-methyltransferase [Fictibacillus gelatini]